MGSLQHIGVFNLVDIYTRGLQLSAYPAIPSLFRSRTAEDEFSVAVIYLQPEKTRHFAQGAEIIIQPVSVGCKTGGNSNHSICQYHYGKCATDPASQGGQIGGGIYCGFPRTGHGVCTISAAQGGVTVPYYLSVSGGMKGDLLMAISTSGNSPNILRAVESARERGLAVVGVTGGNGGKLQNACDLALVVPSSHTPHIQEMHILIAHILCDLIDRHFAGR